MVKIIRVESCSDCKYHFFRIKNMAQQVPTKNCVMLADREKPKFGPPPEWCPLEDLANNKIIQQARALCEKFINKVESGRARSVETYTECINLLRLIDEIKEG